MSTKPKNIIIVGGSLGGLTTGLVLKRLGHHIRIFERSPTSLLQDQGAGIVFGPETEDYFLKHVDINRKVYIPSLFRQLLSRDGEVAKVDERGQKMVSWDLLYFCLRACFDGEENRYCDVPAPREGDGRAEYVYGRKVTGVKDLGGEVEVQFVDVGSGESGSERAEMVIAADGPSSGIRSLLVPEVERKYANYVAWRGTVLESEATELMKRTFVDRFTFFHAPGNQIIIYLIPGKFGSLEPGERLMNWVWYCNYHAESPEYKNLMTDSDGNLHHITMPPGKIQDRIRTAKMEQAKEILPEAFSDLVCRTKLPFVQSITDVISPQASFFDGKLLLVGDALAGFRPHTVASTSQAAHHASLLEKHMKGEMIFEEMLDEMMKYARRLSDTGKRLGNGSQFTDDGIDLKEIAISERVQTNS